MQANFPEERRAQAGPHHWLHSHAQLARWINLGSFAKACHGKSFLLGLPVIPGASTGTQVQQFDKKSQAYHTSDPLATSDRQRARVKHTNVCKSKAWWDDANLKAHIASRAFPREIPVRWRSLRTPFSTTSRRRIFLKPTEIDYSVLQEPISVKNSKSTNSLDFSFQGFKLMQKLASWFFSTLSKDKVAVSFHFLGCCSKSTNFWLGRESPVWMFYQKHKQIKFFTHMTLRPTVFFFSQEEVF